MSWKKKMRKSWFVWFMDYLYYPLAYFLVMCVCFCMVVDWEVLRENWDRLQEEEREKERLGKERLEEERKKWCHMCKCCEKAG
jgi:hypothetical protein